jgi:hypothetical protein
MRLKNSIARWIRLTKKCTVPCRTSFNPDIPVRVEACDIPASGTLDFSDPASASRPARFYRLAFPQ